VNRRAHRRAAHAGHGLARPELTRLHTARPDILRADWDYARSLGLPITMHASQAGAAELRGGEGWLGPDVQFVHGVYATEQDVAILAETGAHMSISPVSDLRIVLGFAPVSDMLAQGIPMSLSFDASSIAGNADMFATMRVAVCAEHARTRDAMTLPPRRALALATIDGARDLGLADRTGSLTPGKRADLILVRTMDLNMAPFVDPYIALVHCAQPANVDAVVIDGRVLISSYRECFGYGGVPRPAVEGGVAADELGMVGEVDAALPQDGVERGQRVERPIGQRFVDQGP